MSKIRNPNYLTLILSIIIFLLLFLLSKFLYVYDKNIQSFYQKLKVSDSIKVSKDILIVKIDEDTLSELWAFPIDRKYYSKVINNLSKENVSVIWMDLFFSEKRIDESDNEFSNSIKESKKVVFWLPILDSWIPQNPLNKFDENLLWKWYVRPNLDIKTNLAFWFTPFFEFKDWFLYEHFSIILLKAYYSYIYETDFLSIKWLFDISNYFLTDSIKIPFSKYWEKDILINYVPYSKFQSVSFLDLYDDNKFSDFKNRFDLEWKIVLIWVTAKWLDDTVNTPDWIIYWVYLHANIINTVLTKNYLTYFDNKLELLLIFLLVIIFIHLNFYSNWIKLIFWNILLIFIFVFWFPFFIILKTSLILNYPLELILWLLFSISSSNVFKYFIELNNKKKLNRALSEYVSKDIASEILSWLGRVNLEWEEKRVAIFFSDIEWFTSITEKLHPKEMISFLRKYLSIMTDIITEDNWFINKYQWDWIFALWWVFWKITWKESYRACRSALSQQKILASINEEFRKIIKKDVHIRIWIHIWNVVVWDIWWLEEWKKKEYTAIWDSVNLASRLEWVNKYFWTKILVSEDIYFENKDNFIFRKIWKIRVKWKEISTLVYELIWEIWDKSISIKNIEDFEKWLNLYFNKDFEKAVKIFKDLYSNWDKASEVYIKECENLIKDPPIDSWDWIISILQK